MAEEQKKKDSVLKDISKQAVEDIIVPKTKESVNNMASDILYMIADTLVQIVGRIIFGQDAVIPTRGSGGREKYSNVSKTKAQPQVQTTINTGPSDNLLYVCVDSYQKADEIKRELTEAITKYGVVRVADLYEKSGKIRPAFTDYNYGWTNVNDVHFVRDRNGYWFNMPKPVQIRK